MPSRKIKILFISHYAGRTGAPLMLLNLLQRAEGEYESLLRNSSSC